VVCLWCLALARHASSSPSPASSRPVAPICRLDSPLFRPSATSHACRRKASGALVHPRPILAERSPRPEPNPASCFPHADAAAAIAPQSSRTPSGPPPRLAPLNNHRPYVILHSGLSTRNAKGRPSSPTRVFPTVRESPDRSLRSIHPRRHAPAPPAIRRRLSFDAAVSENRNRPAVGRLVSCLLSPSGERSGDRAFPSIIRKQTSRTRPCPQPRGGG